MHSKPTIFAGRHRSISRWISVAALRQSLIYRPLAVLLILMMLPTLSSVLPWLQIADPMPQRSGGIFQAAAQGTVFCFPGNPAAIIRSYCTAEGVPVQELVTLESEAVGSYLALHNIPQTEANFVYLYGRKDLRNQVRTIMLSRLIGISQKPASARSAYEQALYRWFQLLVQKNEINNLLETLNHFNQYRSFPCTFELDKNVSKAMGITWERSAVCGNRNTFLGGASVPSSDYFRMYGFMNSYGKINNKYPNATLMAADTQLNVPMIAGIGGAAGALVTGFLGVNLYSYLSWIVANGLAAASGVKVGGAVLTYNAWSVTTSSAIASAGGTAAVTAGLTTVVAIAIAGAITVGIQSVTAQQQIDALAYLQPALDRARTTLPDLNAMVQDSTGMGQYKMNLTFIAETLPDIESTAVIPQHRPNIDPAFKSEDVRGNFQVFETVKYFDWDETQWSLSTYGNWFVQSCIQGLNNVSCRDLGHSHRITGTIRFLNARFERYTASRLGNRFTITKNNPAPTDKPCPADQITGLSPATDFSKCSSYVAEKFELAMVPLSGVRTFGILSITPFTRPTFNEPTLFNISRGVPATFQITANGNPVPEICPAVVATLPSPIRVSGCSNSSITLSYDGTGSPSLGMFPFTLEAKNTVGSRPQGFAVNVSETPVKIITPSLLSTTYGQPVTFTMVASGVPKPRFTVDPGVDLQGLSFRDNLDGTATISGTPARTTVLGPCESGTCPLIRASNGASSDGQNFFVQVDPPPQVFHAGPFEFTVPAGMETEISLQPTGGAITPVIWAMGSNPNLPSWIRFASGADGTGRLTVNPPRGTTGSFPVSTMVKAEGMAFSTGQMYTINVSNAPVFTSPNRFGFTVGNGGSPSPTVSYVTATSGRVDPLDELPPGINGGIDPANSRYMLVSNPGEPPAGTGGVYPVRFISEGVHGTATQDALIQIFERPAVTGSPLAVMFAGRPGEFSVPTLGYPSLGTLVGVQPSAPTNPNDGLGMFFSTQGLPASLKASNLNFAGFPTGTLRISGTPASTEVGTHRVQVTAANGVGTPAQRTVTLVVYPYAPTTSVNLLTNSAIARAADNTFVATVVVSNNGRDAAQRVALNTVRLNGIAGTVVPESVATIDPASSATFTVRFPSNVVVSATNLLSITGSHAGGNFNSTARVVLP
jgi:hypothetical protein